MRFTVKFTTAAGEVLLRDFEAETDEGAKRLVLAEGGFPLDVKRTEGLFHRRR